MTFYEELKNAFPSKGCGLHKLKHFKGYNVLLYLPTQTRFPIGGERVTCHGSKLTNSLGRTKLTNSLGNNNLNFRLARDQVVHLETAANLSNFL